MAKVDVIQELQAEVDELAQRSLDLGEEIKAGKELLKKGTDDVTAEITKEQTKLAREHRANTDAEWNVKERQLQWLPCSREKSARLSRRSSLARIAPSTR